MASAVSEFAYGVGLLPRGLGLIVRRPKLFVLGAIPPLVTSLVFSAIVVIEFVNFESLSEWLSPFADGWPASVRGVVRTAVGVAFIGGSTLLMVVAFTTLTLAIGSPVYDKLSEFVEREFGTVPEFDEPAARGVWRAVRQSLGLIAVSLLGAVVLFFVGFVPLVGQVLAPVLGAILGGWLVSLELTGSTCERRGVLTMAERRKLLRSRRSRVLGFAIPTFLLLAIPFAGAAVFPVATAAGTLLARQLLGEPTTHRGTP
jgi:CysZ protein